MSWMFRIAAGMALLPLAAVALAQFNEPAPLSWRWLQPTTAAPTGTPVSDGAKVYVAVGNRIYALDKETGNQVWRYPIGEPLQSNFRNGEVMAGNLVIAATDDKSLMAIDTATGKLAWQYNSPEAIIGRPIVVNGIVVFATGESTLMAVKADTGAIFWTKPCQVDAGIYGMPAAWQNNIVFTTNKDQVVSIDVNTQRVVWRTNFLRIDPTAVATPVGDTIYINSGTFVTALHAASGRKKWEADTRYELAFGPAVSEAGVAVVSREGLVMSFDKTGKAIFKKGVDLKSYPCASPTFVGKMVAIPTTNGAINLIDPTTGDMLWSFVVKPLSTAKASTGTTGGYPGVGPGGMSGGGMAGGMPGGGLSGGGKAGGGRLGGGTTTDDAPLFIQAAGPAIVSGTTLLLLAKDGSLLAFDKTTGIDLTPPSVKMQWPNPGDQISGKSPLEIWFKVEDEATGINPSSLKITIDGKPVIGDLTREGYVAVKISDFNANKDLLGPARQLDNGRKEIVVTIADWLGNKAVVKFAVTIDNTLPALGGPKATSDTNKPNVGGGKGGGSKGGGKGGVGGGGMGDS